MGQKVSPNVLRYDINRDWISRWATNDNKLAAKWIIEDEKIRKHLLKKFHEAQIVESEIERTLKTILINVKAGQPGLILGKESANVAGIILDINKIVERKIKVTFNVIPFENICLSARVIAREIADAIEKRVSFRVAQKMAIRKVMTARAKGVKTNVSGRLGGVEMAREEGYSEGVIPCSTLRANIDYALEEAHTTYGAIGCKVWINRGEYFKPNATTRPSRETKDGKPFDKERKPFDKDRKPFDRERKQFDRNRKPRFTKSANVLSLPKEDAVVEKKPSTTKEA